MLFLTLKKYLKMLGMFAILATLLKKEKLLKPKWTALTLQ